jgi:hypothetical protein
MGPWNHSLSWIIGSDQWWSFLGENQRNLWSSDTQPSFSNGIPTKQWNDRQSSQIGPEWQNPWNTEILKGLIPSPPQEEPPPGYGTLSDLADLKVGQTIQFTLPDEFYFGYGRSSQDDKNNFLSKGYHFTSLTEGEGKFLFKVPFEVQIQNTKPGSETRIEISGKFLGQNTIFDSIEYNTGDSIRIHISRYEGKTQVFIPRNRRGYVKTDVYVIQ